MEVVGPSVGSVDLSTVLPMSPHAAEEDRIDCLEQRLSELQAWFTAMEARLDVSGLHAITCLEDVVDSLDRHQTITEQIHGRQQDIDQLLLLCSELLHKPAVRMCSPLSLSASDTSCPNLSAGEQPLSPAPAGKTTTLLPEDAASHTGPDDEKISSGKHTEEHLFHADVKMDDKDTDQYNVSENEEHTSHDTSLQQDDDVLQDESQMSVDMEEEEDEEDGDSLQLLALVLELRWNKVTMAAMDIQCRLEEKLNTYKGIYRCTLDREPQCSDETQVAGLTLDSRADDNIQGSDVTDPHYVLSPTEEASKKQDITEFTNDDTGSNKSEGGSLEDNATPGSNGDAIPFRDKLRDSAEVVCTKQTATVEKVSRTVTVEHSAAAERMSRVSTDSLDRIPVKESSVPVPEPDASGPDSDDSLETENSDTGFAVGHSDEAANLHDLDTNSNEKEPSTLEDEAEEHDGNDDSDASKSDRGTSGDDGMDVDSLGSGEETDEYLKGSGEERRRQQEEEVREGLRKAAHDQDQPALRACVERWREAGMSTDEDLYKFATGVSRELEIQSVLREAVRRRSLTDIEKAMGLVRERGLADRLRVDMAEAERVAESLRLLERLRHEVLQLNQSTISEIRSYSNPPKPVHKVMLATFLLLGEDANNMKSWQDVRLLVGKTGKENLKRRVQQCEVKKIRPEVAGTARRILSKFDLDQLRDVSAGAAAFFIWAQGMVQEVEERQKETPLDKETASGAAPDN